MWSLIVLLSLALETIVHVEFRIDVLPVPPSSDSFKLGLIWDRIKVVVVLLP